MRTLFMTLAFTSISLFTAEVAWAARPPRNDPGHLSPITPVNNKSTKPVQQQAPAGTLKGKGPVIPGATGPKMKIPTSVTFDGRPVRTHFIQFRAGCPEEKMLLGPVDPKKPYSLKSLRLDRVTKLRIGSISYDVLLKGSRAPTSMTFGTADTKESFKPKKHKMFGADTYGPISLMLKSSSLSSRDRGEPYALYLKQTTRSSYYDLQMIPGGGRRASIGGAMVMLIDENINGRYNDLGIDSVITVGKGIQRLQQFMQLGKNFCHVEVSPDGAEIKYKKFEDSEPQKVDIKRSFKGSGRISSFIVSGNGSTFDVAQSGTLLPGKYGLVEARIEAQNTIVKVNRGRLPILEVKDDEPCVVEWGKPVELKFLVSQNIIGISISGLSLTGKGGEIYEIAASNPPMVRITGPKSNRDNMTKNNTTQEWQYQWDPKQGGTYTVTVQWNTGIFGTVSKTKTTAKK